MDDIEQIRRLIFEYCYATDSGDIEAWLATFTDDVVWDGGPFGGFRGRDEGRAYIEATDPTPYRHLTINPIIDVQGDSATGKAYLLLLTVAEGATAVAFSGVYEDRYAKEGGRWLIAERHIHAAPAGIGSASNSSGAVA